MEKATRLFKNDGILLSILGMGYEMKGEIDKAIPIYEESVRINPYMGNTYNNLGAIYANKGDYERAAICFLKGLKGFPGDRRLFSNAKMLGLIMIEKGMIDRAERLFSNLDELCTEKDLLLLLHRELAQRYWLLKENELFVKHTERIIELNPQEFEAYRNLGLFFLEKDTERALSYLNKALEIREDENIKRVVAKYR
jgi:tetratricopeptide (TPR) repeat protein